MMVKEYQPDLIVLDVMLPDINGKEVCQRVRSDSTMDDVRIICISGMVEEDKIEDLRGVGRQRFPPQAVRGRDAGRTDVPSAGHRDAVGRLNRQRAAKQSTAAPQPTTERVNHLAADLGPRLYVNGIARAQENDR